VGVENVCTTLPKGTLLRQIWSNKSFGVCGSDVVFTLYGGEKKVLDNRHWKIESSITLHRYCDVVIIDTMEDTPIDRRRDLAVI